MLNEKKGRERERESLFNVKINILEIDKCNIKVLWGKYNVLERDDG